MTHQPSYKEFHAASERASAAARGASRKQDTKCEITLRKALWHAGARYRKNVSTLPGKPDIVFPGARVVVFCDGDFWHGRDWEKRRRKLAQGSNSDYWIAKIERNKERDRENSEKLEELGWRVLRVWETDVNNDVFGVVEKILQLLRVGKLHGDFEGRKIGVS